MEEIMDASCRSDALSVRACSLSELSVAGRYVLAVVTWIINQQQQVSKVQLGHSRADLLTLHS